MVEEVVFYRGGGWGVRGFDGLLDLFDVRSGCSTHMPICLECGFRVAKTNFLV